MTHVYKDFDELIEHFQSEADRMKKSMERETNRYSAAGYRMAAIAYGNVVTTLKDTYFDEQLPHTRISGRVLLRDIVSDDGSVNPHSGGYRLDMEPKLGD